MKNFEIFKIFKKKRKTIQLQNTKKIEGGPFEDFKKFRKKVTKPKKWRGKCRSVEKLEGGTLHFKVEAFGCVQNQALSTFGKSE